MGKFDSILRIITQLPEAKAKLKRINFQQLTPTQIKLTANRIREGLTEVLLRGDEALLEQAELFSFNLQITVLEIEAAEQKVEEELLKAIRETSRNLMYFYEQKIPKSWVNFAEEDVIVSKRYIPLRRIGIYIPAQTTRALMVLMLNSICAQVAQVEQIVLILDPEIKKHTENVLLAAAKELGISEIYRLPSIGAIGALAYGTSSISRVDLILGPSDLEIKLAKGMVAGEVGVETHFSEHNLFIFADAKAEPLWLAKDILAQIQENSSAILLTKSSKLAKLVQGEVEKQLEKLEYNQELEVTQKIILSSLIIVVDSLEIAVELINEFAPQSLQLAVKDPWSILHKIKNAGTVFMGYSTPPIVGTYFGGVAINLLGGGVARFASALSPENFLKQTNVIEYSSSALAKVLPTLEILSRDADNPNALESIKDRLNN
jgi:histidinol dehydrogenase